MNISIQESDGSSSLPERIPRRSTGSISDRTCRRPVKYPAFDEFASRMEGIEVIFEPQVGPYGNGTPLLVASRYLAPAKASSIRMVMTS
jgi:hypothetical protein